MSREDDLSISELRRKREQSQPVAPPPMGGGYGGLPPPPPTNVGLPPPPRPVLARARSGDDDDDEEPGEFHVDIWRMLGALQRQWMWLVAATVVLGALGFAGGYYKGRYTVAVKLIRRDVSSGSEAFKAEALTPETMLSQIRSWDVARRVEAKAQPPVSAMELMEHITIEPEQKTDIVIINLSGKNTNDLVNLANLYAVETIAFTKEYQLKKPAEAIHDNEERAANLDKDIKHAEAEMAAFRKANDVVDPKAEEEAIAKRLAELMSLIRTKKWDQEHSELKVLTDRLAVVKMNYQNDRTRFTPQHPIVVSELAEIARLESQIAEVKASRNSSTKSQPGTNAPPLQPEIPNPKIGQGELLEDEIAALEKDRAELMKVLDAFPEKVRQHVVLKAKLSSLDEVRNTTEKTLLAARQYEKNAEGYFRADRPVTAVDVDTRPRLKKAKGFGMKGAVAGLILAAALVVLMELKDRTMKTAAEVERVTGLRVLASLGDLDKMTSKARDKWAFRAWTIIAGQLNASANHGMVCGFVSSEHGEGRSTWIRLLGEAATRRGLRVLTVATKPSGTDEPSSEAETVANEKSFTEAVAEAMTEKQSAEAEAEAGGEPAGDEFMTLSPRALAFPAEVTQRFNAGGLPAAHIPLPGWVWNLERRRQWQMALAHWRAIDNLVLLVELPPASVPESVLLAESLPQIIWLVDSGKASISDTKEQLDMMRHAKCHLVGAVLNHEPDPIIKL